MKDKIKRFLIDKKELLVFIAVVVVVFATVITIASLALVDTPVVNDDPAIIPNEPVINPDDNNDDPINPNPVVQPTFALPVKGEYVLVRTYFDKDLTDEELVSAIIETGKGFEQSQGVSFAKEDNSTFDVSAIYSGVVLSIEEDELNGTTVTIKHSDGVVSSYSALENVSVKEKDNVELGQVIGQASTSLYDMEAGVHVHLKVKVNNSYVNPVSVFGKEITEVSVSK